MRKYIILLILVAAVAFAQTEINWWVFDGGGGMRSPASGDTMWASIGQGAIGFSNGGTAEVSAGYLYGVNGLVKIDEDEGDFDDDNDGKIDKPFTFGIDGVRPNPFNSACEIEFQIEEFSIVKFEIFDILGNLVERPIDEIEMSEGEYRFTWNASNNPTGTYFARVSTPNKHAVVKLLYLK